MRSGFVAVAGRPNVGKSSLMNRILGRPVAAVSERPQTTWHQTRCIHTDTEQGQMVFVDTPGIHRASSAMNKAMLATALEATLDADALMLVVDLGSLRGDDHALISLLPKGRPLAIAANKIDLLERGEALAGLAALSKIVPKALIVPTSARTGENMDTLLRELFKLLPESPMYYPAADLSDRSTRFLTTELIRQAIFEQLRDEIPYSAFVEIEEFRESGSPIVIEAVIYVERPTQKQILIGSNGAQIRRIGIRARRLIEEMLEAKVYLNLWAKVLKKWTHREHHLRRAGLQLNAKRARRTQDLVDAFEASA